MLFRSWFFVFWASYDVSIHCIHIYICIHIKILTVLFYFYFFKSKTKVFTRQLKKLEFSDGATTFIAGGLSATTFWIGAFPAGTKKKRVIISTTPLSGLFDAMLILNLIFMIDSVKNRYMTQPDVTPKKYPTPMSVAKHIYNTNGLRGFYRGKKRC